MSKLEKLYDRSDAEKWAHPEVAEQYAMLCGNKNMAREVYFNHESLSQGERKAAADEASSSQIAQYLEANPTAKERRMIYTAKGCPEEPDIETEIVVYRPSKPSKRKLPVLFGASGGGMHMCQVEMEGYEVMADRLNCVVVAPRYRTALTAKYPAALNDLHAGYQFTVDHAEELGIHPDKITLYGNSSGSHLALSLAHRLKRYGYRPRGCVVINALADHRPIFATSTIMNEDWDARSQWVSSLQYLGYNNVASFNEPEMYPNYAAPEDCIGLCPTFIHTDAEDAGSGSCKEYTSTLSKAGVYNELHNWGGSCHASVHVGALFNSDADYCARWRSIVDGNLRDCWKYDLRRQWILEELGE